jgi:hypothetical protein
MTMTMIANGKPRKQLSDQLDRMDALMERQDSILDALSEGLNEAVQDAARQGVRDAVKAAVIEMLTDSALRAELHKATAPATDAKPTFWQRVKAKVQQVATRVKAATSTVRERVKKKIEAVKGVASDAAAPAWLAWRLRKVALVGLGIGLVVAAVCYAASHGFAAAISGLGAATTAVAIQGVLWVRKTVRRLAMV